MQAGAAAVADDEERLDVVAAQGLIEEGGVEAAPDPFGEVALVFLRSRRS